MITATTRADRLGAQLDRRARSIAEQAARRSAASRWRGAAAWRSADTLWPGYGLD